MAPGIKTLYAHLRKKHKLPGFDELDAHFEISATDPELFSVREIRKKIAETVCDVSGIIERALQPDTNLPDLYESRVFDEGEKKELFALYKQIMVAERRMSELLIINDEKMDAGFIREFLPKWKKLKLQILPFVKKLRESWEKETEESETAHYMG